MKVSRYLRLFSRSVNRNLTIVDTYGVSTNTEINRSIILKILPAAILLAVFLWMAIAQAGKPLNNESDNAATIESPSASQQVPDPIAPAVESDAQHQPASPSGQASSTSTSVNMSNGETTVTVNGENVPVPENGSVSKTVQNSDGSQTSVNVQSNNSNVGSSTNTSTSITSTQTNSFSNGTNFSSQNTFTSGGSQ
jgi:hypothetical protein